MVGTNASKLTYMLSIGAHVAHSAASDAHPRLCPESEAGVWVPSLAMAGAGLRRWVILTPNVDFME